MRCPNCGTTLPAGSRFCNGCGSAMGAPGAPAQAPVPRPQAPPQPQPWTGSPQPNSPSPGHRPVGSPNPFAAAPPAAGTAAPSRKPVGLLIGVVVLLVAAVAVGGVVVVQGRMRAAASVTASQTPELPLGPGVQQAASPEAPNGPGLMASRVPPPPKGPSVVAQAEKPNDMAPSVLLGTGTEPPRAPSVVSGNATPQVPEGPSPLAFQPPQPPAGPPVTASGGGSKPPPPKPQPRPQQPPDHRDLERYLEWLRYVENERVTLRAQAQGPLLTEMLAPLQNALALTDPDVNENVLMAQDQQRKGMLFRNIQRAMHVFHANVRRTKPPVPQDCRVVDFHFMGAMQLESELEMAVINAFLKNDLGRLMVLKQTGVRGIDSRLRQANFALRQVFRGRNLPESFEITSGNGAGLGGPFQGLF